MFLVTDMTCPARLSTDAASPLGRPPQPKRNLHHSSTAIRISEPRHTPSWVLFAATIPFEDEVNIGSHPLTSHEHILLLVVIKSFHFVLSSNAVVGDGVGLEKAMRGGRAPRAGRDRVGEL